VSLLVWEIRLLRRLVFERAIDVVLRIRRVVYRGMYVVVVVVVVAVVGIEEGEIFGGRRLLLMLIVFLLDNELVSF